MSDFGLKIGLEGEKAFKNSLREINQSFKVLGSEMKLVDARFDKNDKSIRAVTARNEVLNREIDAQKGKVDTLRTALENASASFGETDKRTQSWQIQLNNAQAELLGMERKLEANNRELDEAGDEFKQAETQADKFGDELDRTAKDADEAEGKFSKMGNTLKSVGKAMGVALAAVGVAAAAAAKSLASMTVGAAQYADEMLTMSTITGMSTESLQAYKYAAGLVDVSLETMTGSMARNIRSMTQAQQGTGQAGEAYKQLGVSVTDAAGNLRDGETVYWETIDALGKIEDETQRNAIAMQIFGKSALELNPLIMQGSEGIAKLTEEAKRMGAVMSDDALKRLGEFDDAMQRLQAGSAAAKNALGLILLPQLKMLSGEGVDLLGNFTRGIVEAEGDWTKISKTIGDTIGNVVDMAMKVLPEFIHLGMDIVLSIINSIVENLPALTEAATEIAITLVEGLINALPKLLESGVKMIITLVQGITENIPRLIEAAIEAVTTIMQTLIDNAPLLLDAATILVWRLTQGILDAIPQLIDKLPELISAIVNFIVEEIPTIVDTGFQLLTSIIGALPEIIAAIVDAIPKIVTAIVDAIVLLVPKLIDAGLELLTALIEDLPTIIETIVDALPKIVNAIVDALIGAIPQLIDAGVKLLIAIVENLPLIIRVITDALPEIIGAVVSTLARNIPLIVNAGVQLLVALVQNMPAIIAGVVKAIPEIISSLVSGFRESIWQIANVGKDLIRGFWEGISDMGGWIKRQISGFMGNIVGSIKDFFGISSPSKMFAGIGGDLASGLGIGFENMMAKVRNDMQHAIPTQFTQPQVNLATAGEGVSEIRYGSLITIQNMTVRSDADIEAIGRYLKRQIQWS